MDEVQNWCLQQQRKQYSHDKRNHFDILSLHKNDRLKHYGLHFAKYAGRLARNADEEKAVAETAIDSLLICLSSANTLSQKLIIDQTDSISNSAFLDYVSYTGRFCDACEKIDHLEGFTDLAQTSNQALFTLSVSLCHHEEINIDINLSERRSFLKNRQFYIED